MKLKCCKSKSSEKEIRQVVEFLKIISEENRLKILCILRKDKKCVCEIWRHLKLSQNLTSHHLKALKDFNLISSKKDGLKVFYSINKRAVKKYALLLNKFLKIA